MKGEKGGELLGTGEMAAKWVTNGFILTAHFVEDSFDPAPADYLRHAGIPYSLSEKMKEKQPKAKKH